LIVYHAQPDRPPDSDGSLDRIRAAGKVTIGMAMNFPPMEFMQDGKLTGFDVDLIEAVADRLGVRPDYINADWDWPEVPAALNAHRCDLVIGTWTITNPRKREAAFVEYLRMRQVFVCARGINVNTEQDLADRIVVVGLDSVQHHYVRGLKAKGLAIKEIKVLGGGGEDAFDFLRHGKADVAIIEEPVARYHARLDPENLHVGGSVGHALDPDPIGIALRHEDRQLQDAVAAAIGAMKDDGTFARVLDKWFGR
jgi:polar amino acid transport system substrate-binding protein